MDIYAELKFVRQAVTKSVMDYLMSKVYASIQYRIKKIDDETYYVY